MSDPAGILLRRARVDDAAAITVTMSDPAVARQLLQLPYGSEEFWRKRLTEMSGGSGSAEVMLVAELDGAVVGNAGVHPFANVRRRHAAGLGIGVAPAAQGRGVGTALMAALVDWADRWTQLLRLELTVYADNERAIALYRRFGFIEEGRHRAYSMRDGAYVDTLAMARLHPNPPRLPT